MKQLLLALILVPFIAFAEDDEDTTFIEEVQELFSDEQVEQEQAPEEDFNQWLEQQRTFQKEIYEDIQRREQQKADPNEERLQRRSIQIERIRKY